MRAHAAAAAAAVELRALRTVADADAIGRVIVATWGEQPIGPEVVRALAESGNEPYGAFDGDELVAFVLGWAGVDQDGLHVHSHMLAVVPDRRHGGLGYALKLAQRAQALERGIHVARWTFDPLIARNAHLNLTKLGAIADRFERDFYGAMGDALNRGDRTDRVTVRWHLDAEPGARPLPVAPDATAVLLARAGAPDQPEPATADVAMLGAMLVEVPSEYHDLRQREPALGERWRDATAEAFERCLTHGLVGSGFMRDRSAYVFVPGTTVTASPVPVV